MQPTEYAKRGERMMDVDPSFLADGEASESVEPCEVTLDYRSVAATSLTGHAGSAPRLHGQHLPEDARA